MILMAEELLYMSLVAVDDCYSRKREKLIGVESIPGAL
jgi:hypothetical protein